MFAFIQRLVFRFREGGVFAKQIKHAEFPDFILEHKEVVVLS